jgi:hypothetical protein
MKASDKKTVDVQHARKLEELARNRGIAESLRKDVRRIDAALAELRAVPRSELSDAALAELLQLQDQRRSVEARLARVDGGAEIDYILEAGDVLFRYYDLVENGAKVYAPPSKQPGTQSIIKYFSLKAPEPGSAVAVSGSNSDNRASLLEDYMSIVDPMYVRCAASEPRSSGTAVGIDEDNVGPCGHCGSAQRTVRMLEGFIECNQCYAMEDVLVDHDKPSYKEPPKEASYFSYKRMNHLNEHLSQSQGRESTNIDDHIIDMILIELKKQKITNMMDVTASKIKEILKKLRINKYYEHSAHILSRLTGKPVPNLSPELEEQLRIMFRMIQYPFLVHAPATRKNFLSYSFVLHKSLQLLGHDEFLPSFPLLKSRDKLAQQDAIWKKICADLNWEFVPSL